MSWLRSELTLAREMLAESGRFERVFILSVIGFLAGVATALTVMAIVLPFTGRPPDILQAIAFAALVIDLTAMVVGFFGMTIEDSA